LQVGQFYELWMYQIVSVYLVALLYTPLSLQATLFWGS